LEQRAGAAAKEWTVHWSGGDRTRVTGGDSVVVRVENSDSRSRSGRVHLAHRTVCGDLHGLVCCPTPEQVSRPRAVAGGVAVFLHRHSAAGTLHSNLKTVGVGRA